ncbi:glycosyl transferase [Spirochaetia bacterium]|nr:glycosyl transferase [Spirochaetia bacterium]
MIPKIIHYCWLSDNPIPDEFQYYISTWKNKLFDYEFVLWNFDRFDINSSIWVKQAFEAKKYAFAADYIRLYAVYNYGGIYLDIDVEVIKSFNSLLKNNYMLAYEDNKTKNIEGGCFGAEKGFWFIGACLDYLKGRPFFNADETYNMIPLPTIMRKIYNESSIGNEIIFLTEDFFTSKSWVTGVISVTENTYCIHNFSGSWLSEKEKYYTKIKVKLCRFLGRKIGTFLYFPFFIIMNFQNYGIKIGLKKILNKVIKI